MTQQVAKRVTLTKVADRLGLSPATISLVLNGRSKQYGICKATAETVRAEVKKMNYRPSIAARQLLGKRSGVVGVLINTEAVADTRLIQKMEVLAAERGIRFMVGHAVGTPERVKDYLDDFLAHGVDGLIAIFHNHPDYKETMLQELSRFEHVVYYEKPSGGVSVDSTVSDACYVQPDFYEAGRLGARHLIDRGRRRIALVLDTMVFPYGEAWRRGYENALTRISHQPGTSRNSVPLLRRSSAGGNPSHCLPLRQAVAHRDEKYGLKAAGRLVEDSLVWVMDQQLSVPWTDPFTQERALRAVDELVIDGGADGIVTIRDTHALRIMAALRERGRRVPDDVAVVGCDGLEIGTMVEPQLTTIDLGLDELARATVELLFELIDCGSVPEERRAVVARPELIVRHST